MLKTAFKELYIIQLILSRLYPDECGSARSIPKDGRQQQGNTTLCRRNSHNIQLQMVLSEGAELPEVDVAEMGQFCYIDRNCPL